MNIEQQRDYVETLREMWFKTRRVCGVNSKPEKALLDILVEQKQKLKEMEDGNECD